jgi:hypothetical protein
MSYAVYKFSFESNVVAVSNPPTARLGSFGVFAVVLSIGLIAAAMFLPQPHAVDAGEPASYAQATPF